jgi:Fic family protein
MKSLDINYLNTHSIPIELGQTIQKLGEYKGKQDLYTKQTPQVLETLKQAAMIQSAESSNRIEGITVVPERLKAIMANKSRPKDRSEAEIVGYRNVLARIHTQFDMLEVNAETILKFHAEISKGRGIEGGVWKRKDNMIEEKLDDGRWITRFVPVSARETPCYIKETCKQLDRLWDEGKISKLLLIPSFILDFLCIHPFTDGNGRISRLLMVLLLHRAGYEVGRYISLERIIEDSKESYYDVLHKASQKWHEGEHNVKPWWEYFLGTIISAYSELEERVGVIIKGRGAKTNLIQSAVENMPSIFGILDIERACPSVGRDMIRVVLNSLRKSGKLKCTGIGRGAKWSKK